MYYFTQVNKGPPTKQSTLYYNVFPSGKKGQLLNKPCDVTFFGPFLKSLLFRTQRW